MTVDTQRPTPRSAVLNWWRALQNKDVAAIERMTLDDYISSGGPGARTVDKNQFLEGTGQFLAGAVIEDWVVSGLEVRQHRDVAVCSYLWSERGSHEGVEFDLHGVATDVLVFEEGRWRHQAHHVSMSGGKER
jgi:ketosteroid isomerase-like protein